MPPLEAAVRRDAAWLDAMEVAWAGDDDEDMCMGDGRRADRGARVDSPARPGEAF